MGQLTSRNVPHRIGDYEFFPRGIIEYQIENILLATSERCSVAHSRDVARLADGNTPKSMSLRFPPTMIL